MIGFIIFIVKKIITAKKPGQIKFAFDYKFAPKTNAKPRERAQTLKRYASGNCASVSTVLRATSTLARNRWA